MSEHAKEIIRDILVAVLIVAIVASIAYAVAGTWPVAVCVPSKSMEPNIHVGDLVFISGRSHITTYETGKVTGYKSFGDYGDVIVYRPNGDSSKTPIIHRAMEKTEDGYVTKGDGNPVTDQRAGLSRLVKRDWVIGVAKLRIPYIGYIPLAFRSIF